MNWEAILELRGVEAHKEIKEMAARAQEEIARRFAFLNRSIAQKKRFARQRKGVSSE